MGSQRSFIAFIATNDPERSLSFYRGVLELELVEDTPFASVFILGGTMLRIQKTSGHLPAPHTALGLRVAAIVEEMQALSDRGVTFERFQGLEQDGLGIWTAPDGSRIAWFKDPDGNLLSLTQFA